jgi:cold shock CspA family protein
VPDEVDAAPAPVTARPTSASVQRTSVASTVPSASITHTTPTSTSQPSSPAISSTPSSVASVPVITTTRGPGGPPSGGGRGRGSGRGDGRGDGPSHAAPSGPGSGPAGRGRGRGRGARNEEICMPYCALHPSCVAFTMVMCSMSMWIADVRETGVVTTVKDSFGFINCADRDAQMFFHFSDYGDGHSMPSKGDEVSFTVVTDLSNGRLHAASIQVLPKVDITVHLVCSCLG